MASDRRSMMGGFQSIFSMAFGTGRRTSRPGSRTRTAAALLAAALLYGAGPATAESPSLDDPPVQTGQRASRTGAREAGATVAAAKARVSMSAERQASSPPPASEMKRRTAAGDDGLPLTRAAARQRVEAMSPAAWLAHFGPVAIERHE